MRDFCECRPFLVHMRAEHERLHADVSKIEQALSASDDPIAPVRIRQSLTDLRDDLIRHFDEEEQGGCIEEATCRCPRLSGDASAVEHEHPRLLTRVGLLIERACRSEFGVDDQFASDFRQFARKLQALEAAEHRILIEAFGCAGDEDL